MFQVHFIVGFCVIFPMEVYFYRAIHNELIKQRQTQWIESLIQYILSASF